MAKRRRSTPGFEAHVALEALREDRTAPAIAARRQPHPNQASQWKRKASEEPAGVFEGARPKGGARTRRRSGRYMRRSGSW